MRGCSTRPEIRIGSLRIWIAIAVLVLAAVPALPAANLVSNIEGKIRVVILHFGNGQELGFWYDQTVLYKELFSKMDPDVGFIILLGKDEAALKARENLGPFADSKLPDGTARIKFLEVGVTTSRFYPWARDAYLLLWDAPDKLTFLDCGFNEKPFPVTTWDRILEGAVSWAGAISRGGGNIRATDDEVFVGMDTLLKIKTESRWVGLGSRSYDTLFDLAKDIKPADVPEFRRRFEAHAEFVHRVLAPGKRLIIPEKDLFFSQLAKGAFPFNDSRLRDTGAQAAYHTDVYIGVGPKDRAGRRTLFMADTGAASRIILKMSPEARRTAERNLPRLLVQEGFTAAGIPVSEAQIATRMVWDRRKLLDAGQARAAALASRYDAAAASMARLGYRIVRVPFLPNGLNDAPPSNDGVLGLSFNYSNVLAEVYGEVKKVYMPVFGLKELDDAASAAYAGAGFKVVPIRGLLANALAQHDANAGLDCLTSEIRFPVRWTRKGKQP